MQERLIGVARDLESAMDVQVTLPALASIEDLFGGSTSAREPRDAPASPPEAASPWAPGQARVAQAAAAQDETREEPEQPIVIGEAAIPVYDHPPEEEEPLMDPSYEELWEGTDAMKIELPEIPALDLDWGQEGDPA
jgi:hypothetical protein